MDVSLDNSIAQLINIHEVSMPGAIGVHFSLFVGLVQLLLELEQVGLFGNGTTSLRDFRKRSSEAFEEESASLDDLNSFFTSLVFFYFINLDEVNQSADTILIKDFLSLRVDDRILLLLTGEDPSEIVQGHFSVSGHEEEVVLSTEASV